MKRLLISDTDVFGMTNISPDITGLHVKIWAQNEGSSRNLHHNIPRVKIQSTKDGTEISVSIEQNPRILAGKNSYNSCKASIRHDLNEGIRFVGDNYDLFLKHFNSSDENPYSDAMLLKDLFKRGQINW